MSQPPVRVAVLDGHELFRRGLALLLDSLPGVDVVGQAAAGALSDHEADVVLVDAASPGVTACAAIREAQPDARVLVLIAAGTDADLYGALGAGASGFLHKDASLDELVEGIRVVADGQSLISPALAAALVGGFGAGVDQGRQRELTARETEVLRLVAQGLSNRGIAQRLSISENTVKNHVRNLLDKLQLRSRTEAAMYAVRTKLVDP